MLVLHSFHYPGRKIGRGKGEYEQYSRDVALALEHLHIDGIIVKESPRKRYFPRLLKKYDADWVLDLHDDMGKMNQYFGPEFNYICCVLHAWSGEPRKENDVLWHARVEKGMRMLYAFSEKTYRMMIPIPQRFNGLEPAISPGSGSLEPRVLGIELYAGRPFSQSLDFLKKLTDYLQGVSL